MGVTHNEKWLKVIFYAQVGVTPQIPPIYSLLLPSNSANIRTMSRFLYLF